MSVTETEAGPGKTGPDNTAQSKTGRAAASREEILRVAAQLFRARGYADTGLRDLASAAGLKAGSLYYHFSSKEALAAEVLRLGVDHVSTLIEERLTSLPASASAADRLQTAIRAHLDALLSESDFTSAHIRCFPYAPDAVRGGLREARRNNERIWERLIDAYLAEAAPGEVADPRYIKMSILGALNWSLEWFDPARDDAQSFAETLSSLLLTPRKNGP